MADRMIRRTLPHNDWLRIKAALLTDAAEADAVANKFALGNGDQVILADELRREAGANRQLASDLSIGYTTDDTPETSGEG